MLLERWKMETHSINTIHLCGGNSEKLEFDRVRESMPTWSRCCQWNRASDSNFPTLNSSSTSKFRRPKYPKARSGSSCRSVAWPTSRSTNKKSTACICRTRRNIFPCDTHSRPIQFHTMNKELRLLWVPQTSNRCNVKHLRQTLVEFLEQMPSSPWCCHCPSISRWYLWLEPPRFAIVSASLIHSPYERQVPAMHTEMVLVTFRFNWITQCGDTYIGHVIAELQTHANIHGVIDQIRLVDDIENLLP